MITITPNSSVHYIEEGLDYSLWVTGTLTETLNSLHYSYNNGSTWSSALDTVPAGELPIPWSGEGSGDPWSVRILIPQTDYTNIFPTVDGEVVRTNAEILFRAVGADTTEESLVPITFNLITGVEIKPNYENTMDTPSEATSTNKSLHTRKFHTSESVNVIWDTTAGTVDPDLLINVSLQWQGSSELISISGSNGVPWGSGHKVISLEDFDYPDSQDKASLARIVITSFNQLGPQIQLTGGWFCVTDKIALSDGVSGGEADDVLPQLSYPQRTELYSRTAVEKGIFMDEAVTISQLEAGTGVIIRQRDHTGRKVGYTGEAGALNGPIYGEDAEIYNAENPIDYAKAYNLVIEVDPQTIPVPARPRAKHGVVNFNTVGGLVEAVPEADNQYGQLRKYTITHDWNLGDINDAEYKPKQTANSYHLEFVQVPSANDATPFGWQYNDAVPLYATISRDAIEAYCVVKNANVAGLEPVLSKDSVVFGEGSNPSADPVPSYIFEWHLVEVIPNPADV